MRASALRSALLLLGFVGSGLQVAAASSKRAEWPAGTPRPNLTGFWKTDCHYGFGVKIEPAGGDLYSLSFCGPGGCFAPGTWTPNSPIFGDKSYGVIDADTIQLPFGDDFRTYRRCASQAAEPGEAAKDTASNESTGESASGVHFKAYYEGLPDLDKVPPFAAQTTEQANALHLLIEREKGSTASCARQSSPVPGTLEICGQGLASARQMLKAAAHGLPAGRFSRIWLVDLNGDRERELLGQYDVAAKPQEDRYTAFFAFQWNTGRYRVTAASWFLEGALLAVRSFGSTRAKKAFLRFESCTECEPWVYLTVVDFTVPPIGAGYEFGYDLQHPQERHPEIEYVLPGMGHSIDAKVETRVPVQPDLAGPHLLQHFAVVDGEDEWWSFTCKGLQCDPEMSKGNAPVRLLEQWKKAVKL
ncbi:MAG TPA: hypothetical protein VFC29_17380 [Candidatus Limnocylindrales bacterium]|nr:hypothetical protein [Candidatus Limnocylindrales bacterium]